MTHRDHLVAMLAILKRQGGFMRPVDQCAVREAEASTAQSEIEAALAALEHEVLPSTRYACGHIGCDQSGIPASLMCEPGHSGTWCAEHRPRRVVPVVVPLTPVVVVQLQRDDRALAGTMRGRAGAAITAHVRANAATLRDNAETDVLIAAEKLPIAHRDPKPDNVIPVVVPLDYKPPTRRLQPKSTAIAERIAQRRNGSLPRVDGSRTSASAKFATKRSALELANSFKLKPRVVTPTPRATFDIHDGAVTETTKERA